MTCGELKDHYELYALGIAEEPERSEIRAHLDRICEVCTAEARAARQLTALIGASAPAVHSPVRLRRRILASVGGDSRNLGWVAGLSAVAALSLCAAVYFSGRERQFSDEAEVLRTQTRSQAIELTHLNEAFAILNAPGTTVTSFGEKEPKPKGKLFVNPAQGFLLIASNLPPAPAGKAYETWIIDKSGKPAKAGMFQANPDGTAMYMERHAMNMSAMGIVAVTLEVEAGVDAPTSAPIIAAPVPALQ